MNNEVKATELLIKHGKCTLDLIILRSVHAYRPRVWQRLRQLSDVRLPARLAIRHRQASTRFAQRLRDAPPRAMAIAHPGDEAYFVD